jgi:hypothetical protein
VDDVSISLEHVDLLDSLDRLDIELLECSLQLLVVHTRALVYLLDLSSRCAFSTVAHLLAFLDLISALLTLSISRDTVFHNRRICKRETQYVPYGAG